MLSCVFFMMCFARFGLRRRIYIYIYVYILNISWQHAFSAKYSTYIFKKKSTALFSGVTGVSSTIVTLIFFQSSVLVISLILTIPFSWTGSFVCPVNFLLISLYLSHQSFRIRWWFVVLGYFNNIGEPFICNPSYAIIFKFFLSVFRD